LFYRYIIFTDIYFISNMTICKGANSMTNLYLTTKYTKIIKKPIARPVPGSVSLAAGAHHTKPG
ncbi:MAG: hypothetical protein WCO98_17555, partial [bacterium]